MAGLCPCSGSTALLLYSVLLCVSKRTEIQVPLVQSAHLHDQQPRPRPASSYLDAPREIHTVGTTPTSFPSSLACRLHRLSWLNDRMTGMCCLDPELPLDMDEYCLHSSLGSFAFAVAPAAPVACCMAVAAPDGATDICSCSCDCA